MFKTKQKQAYRNIHTQFFEELVPYVKNKNHNNKATTSLCRRPFRLIGEHQNQ